MAAGWLPDGCRTDPPDGRGVMGGRRIGAGWAGGWTPDGSGIPGQPEHPLRHDVALHLGRPPTHGEGGSKEKTPGPDRILQTACRLRQRPRPGPRRHLGPRPHPRPGPDPSSIPNAPARSRATPITCCPCASANALRTDASAPGWRPANTAETIRSRSTRKIRLSTHTSTRRSRSTADGAPPAERISATRSSAVGPIPHRAPSPDSETRSLPSVTLARSHPPCSGPMRWSAGMRTSVKKTSLNACSPVMSMSGRISIPGASIGHTK